MSETMHIYTCKHVCLYTHMHIELYILNTDELVGEISHK